MLRTRMRWLIATVVLLATLATTLLAGPAIHSTLAASNRPQAYLALGDSVAFGFNPTFNFSNPNNFIGYPTPVAAALKETLTNAACPGETSSHFVNINGLDNNCGAYRSQYPLHVSYSSATETQLEFTDEFLQSNPKTLVVSINIGANDLFVLQNNVQVTSVAFWRACLLCSRRSQPTSTPSIITSAIWMATSISSSR